MQIGDLIITPEHLLALAFAANKKWHAKSTVNFALADKLGLFVCIGSSLIGCYQFSRIKIQLLRNTAQNLWIGDILAFATVEAKPFRKYSIGELPAFTALLGIEKCMVGKWPVLRWHLQPNFLFFEINIGRD